MDSVLWIVIGVFAVFVIIALIFIIKACTSIKSVSEIHISGGASIDRGYLSNDDNYFKGGYGGFDETVVIGVDHRQKASKLNKVRMTNLRSGEVFTLDISNPVVLGRIARAGGFEVKGDPSISKSHCKLYVYSGSVYVEDLNSSNHTFVNSGIISAPTKLNSGDVVKIGYTTLKIEF